MNRLKDFLKTNIILIAFSIVFIVSNISGALWYRMLFGTETVLLAPQGIEDAEGEFLSYATRSLLTKPLVKHYGNKTSAIRLAKPGKERWIILINDKGLMITDTWKRNEILLTNAALGDSAVAIFVD
jgi:hypothetical protein